MIAKRVVINGVEDVELQEYKLDKHISPQQCLVETLTSLISPGTELSRVYGLKKGAAYPVYPGYCSVGRLLEVGDELPGFQQGDMVLFSGPHSSVQVFDAANSDGGMLYKLAETTQPRQGVYLMMAWIAINGLLPVDAKPGDTVVIIGLGLLGLISCALYKDMGLEVIAVDPMEMRCAKAFALGADHAIDAPLEMQQQAISQIIPHGADIVLEASGASHCAGLAVNIAATDGQVVLLGSPRTSYTTDVTPILSAIHTKMLTVIGAFNRRYSYSRQPGSRQSMQRSLLYLEGLMRKGTLDTDILTTHNIKPEAIMQAYAGLMYDKESYLGVVIQWQ